ncbi:hypothetical protein [Thalassobaculum litoreum]|uniref:Uncharacterized protein n=1 Tax=Thalassobaculum litoreum DSM 18839 TaxID=1123362 RepID=A0A8G2BH75_9PROT|nr:hypothetical protein [Thalassobaculum litoreum]SDF28368.1 hypothetical protein SAMN05660686_00886 [Thalassobaculum litoreum DSM 18839]
MAKIDRQRERLWRSVLADMQGSGLIRPGQAQAQIMARLGMTHLMRWPLVMLALNILFAAMFWWLAYACWAADNARAAWIFGSIAGIVTMSVALMAACFARASNRRRYRDEYEKRLG